MRSIFAAKKPIAIEVMEVSGNRVMTRFKLENGKLPLLTSGGREFRQHAEHAEGSDTTPRLARSESTAHRVKKQQHHQIANRAAQPSRAAAPRSSDAHKSASPFRRLSAFLESASGQGQKAAKFAVLTPDHAGFPNRAKRSEGSDSTPIRNARVSACVPLCAIL